MSARHQIARQMQHTQMLLRGAQDRLEIHPLRPCPDQRPVQRFGISLGHREDDIVEPQGGIVADGLACLFQRGGAAFADIEDQLVQLHAGQQPVGTQMVGKKADDIVATADLRLLQMGPH